MNIADDRLLIARRQRWNPDDPLDPSRYKSSNDKQKVSQKDCTDTADTACLSRSNQTKLEISDAEHFLRALILRSAEEDIIQLMRRLLRLDSSGVQALLQRVRFHRLIAHSRQKNHQY